jgi:hypothetical protein
VLIEHEKKLDDIIEKLEKNTEAIEEIIKKRKNFKDNGNIKKYLKLYKVDRACTYQRSNRDTVK